MTGTTTHLTTAERKPGWEHIPVYPRGFIGLRIAQLVLGFLVLGLSAFGIWGLAISGTCLTLFVAIATLITIVWLLVAHYAKPKIYNYWAVLVLDIFLVVFWLVAFAVLASQVSTLYSLLGLSSYYYDYSYYYSSSSLESAIFTAWLACQAAAAALGGVLFVLFVITLVLHSMALHRHRAAGRHSSAGSAATPGADASAPELAPYNDKTNPVQSYPAPVYTQTQPDAGYPPQQQQQQQFYDPSTATSPLSATQAQQGYYAPQQQYVEGQHQPQYHHQQPVYPPQTSSPPPLSAQCTGSSVAPAQQQPPPPQNNAVEVPAQAYQQH